MTVAHILFNDNTQYGKLLRSPLNKMEEAISEFIEIKGTMQLMLDGNGSDDSHYSYMQEKFGFLDNASAHSAWNELNSVLYKLTTNETTDHVYDALLQVFNKFR